MKPIEKDELYEHLGHFLKAKGIEMKEGSYSKGIHAGCSLLADAINLSQAGVQRAKVKLDKRLDQMRQVIHERTAPKSAVPPAARENTTANNKKPVSEAGQPASSARRKKKSTPSASANQSSKSKPRKQA